MKRLAALVLLAILSMTCAVPAHADHSTYGPEYRRSQKAAKKQAKAMRKAAKKENRAMKKAQKANRKRSRAQKHT